MLDQQHIVLEDCAQNKIVWMGTLTMVRSLFYVKGICYYDNLKDSLIWKESTSGMYSAKQYCKYVLSLDSMNFKLWKLYGWGFYHLRLRCFIGNC